VKHAEPTSGAKASLKYTVEILNGETRIALAGAIDENADLAGLFGHLAGPTVFNMRDVERVNSMGVHSWVPLINKVPVNHKLAIEELSYPLVQSANAVANMFGAAVLRSCVAPYFCARCKQNVNLTVTAEEVAAAGGEVPVKQCSRCRMALEFDELDGYFAFFKRTRK
jgi:hypothetical protein